MAHKGKNRSNNATLAAERPLREGWRMVRFGDVVRNVKVTVDRANNPYERYVTGAHMRTEDIHIREWGEFGQDYVGPAFHRSFLKGQVLYGSRRTYLKKVALADFDGVTANTTFVLETKDQNVLLQELLPFIMLTDRFTEHSIRESKGSTNPYINWPDIAKYEFPLPPRDEQRRIAEILWAAEEVTDAHGDLMADAWEARQALIDQVVPVGEAVKGRTGAKDLGTVCSMQNGRPFPSRDYTDEGIRLVRPGNLASDGTFDWSPGATAYLPDKYAEENPDHIVKPDDIVMNLTAQSLEDAFIGRVCLAGPDDGGLLNQRLGRFFFDASILPEYAFRCMQTTCFRRLVESRCEGSKIRHIYFRHFADLPVEILSLEEQRRLVGIVAKVEEAYQAARTAERICRKTCTDLRESFLTGKVQEEVCQPLGKLRKTCTGRG